MTVEIELKLKLPKTQNRRFQQWVKTHLAHAIGPVVEHQVSLYFDTPALDLAHQGMGLRLRREGNHWIQTLKIRQQAGAGLHQHEECNTIVANPSLELNRLDPGPAADFIQGSGISGQLNPLFQTDIKRTLWIVTPAPGTRIELALDSGHIISGTRSLPINEIELELLQGDLQAVYALGEQLAEHLSLSLQNQNKAEQGYRLYLGHATPHQTTHLPEPKLTAVTESRQAMQTMVLAHIQYLQSQLSAVLAMPEHLESIHQAHIALRRLRSLRQAFSRIVDHERWKILLPDLKWLMEKIGNVRDLDVFMDEILLPMEHIPAFKSQLAPIRQRVIALRTQRYEELDWALASARSTTLQLKLLAWVTLPVTHPAPLAIEKLAQQALHRLQSKVRHSIHDLHLLTDDQRHSLRKDLKTLRYTVEFFGSLFKHRRVEHFLIPLQNLQKTLGTLNDGRSARALIEQLLQQHPELKPATDAVAGWIAHQEALASLQAEKAALTWLRTRTFW